MLFIAKICYFYFHNKRKALTKMDWQMKNIDYYFDFLSPYSYFSWFEVQKLSQEFSLKISYYPVILGRLLNHWGIKGPADVTPKRNYLFRHCLRLSQKNGVPFKTPAQLPFNSLYALRLALLENSGERQKEVIQNLWQWGWQKGRDLGNPDELIEALQNANLPGEELMERSFERTVREALKQNTQKAIDAGVFGVPSFVVDNEVFWGMDSLIDLKQLLLGQDSLDVKAYQEFLQNYVFSSSAVTTSGPP